MTYDYMRNERNFPLCLDFKVCRFGKIYTYSLQVICERLGDSQQFRDLTVRHLEEFAGEGLRTLCYAVADISPEFYEVCVFIVNSKFLLCFHNNSDDQNVLDRLVGLDHPWNNSMRELFFCSQ